MSPEQGSGDPGLGPRSDLYSLACVLYEMLAGEPPFTGRTPQAVIARHLSEPPPTLRIVRPTVSPGLQKVIEKALAKVPADRFASVDEFLQELENDGTADTSGWLVRIRKPGVAVAAVVLAAIAVLGLFRPWLYPSAKLDPNRIVVFPFRDEAGVGSSAGEGVATYIGYALEGIEPLRWLDGWDLLEEDQSTLSRVSTARARSVSQARLARYYIDGAIIRGGDSVTVVARLYDVAGDSLLQRAGAAAAASQRSLPQLGLRAVAELLPALLNRAGRSTFAR